jgi:hypothetical protein
MRYCLDNGLEQGYEYIRAYYDEYTTIYSRNELFDKYISVTKDTKLLIDKSEDLTSISGWTCLNYLLDKFDDTYNRFAIKVVLNYMNLEHSEYRNSGLLILFKLNHSDAIRYYISDFRQHSKRFSQPGGYLNYNVVNDYTVFESLFNLIYGIELDESMFSGANDLMRTYLGNISKSPKHYKGVQIVLKEIRGKLDPQIDNLKLFYINLLIDVSFKNYTNSLSSPMSFESAKKKTEEIFNR